MRNKLVIKVPLCLETFDLIVEVELSHMVVVITIVIVVYLIITADSNSNYSTCSYTTTIAVTAGYLLIIETGT